MAAVARPQAYPTSYQTVDDVEKGGVEDDLGVGLDVARQGFVRKTLGENLAHARPRLRRRFSRPLTRRKKPNRPKKTKASFRRNCWSPR
jgi:hypothetical protein